MRKLTIMGLILLLILNGCSKVEYSNEFKGVPIYPSTQLLKSGAIEKDKFQEMYVDMSFTGDVDRVKKFFEKNIERNKWEVKEIEKPIAAHGIDKIYAYSLKNQDSNASISIAYTSNEKTGKQLYITIIGDR